MKRMINLNYLVSIKEPQLCIELQRAMRNYMLIR